LRHFPKKFLCNSFFFTQGCLSGPVKIAESGTLRYERFYPFDKYLGDPDLDLFEEDFVNELVHKRKPDRVIFEMKTIDGVTRRMFKAHGPRRLREELQSKQKLLTHVFRYIL
jgi:hypothetical protein